MKYRRMLAVLLALLLSLALAACGDSADEDAQAEAPAAQAEEVETTEPQIADTEDPSLTRLREEIDATGNLMGAAFLGTLSEGGQEAYDELVSDWLDAWPFLADLDWEDAAVASGMEVYCVVPRDPGSVVTVTEWIIDESNGYQGEAGQTLCETNTGAPVLMMGNISDIMPNLRVTVTAPNGQSLSYSPCLSLCDGTLDRGPDEGVYDFSIYFDLPPMGIPDFTGTWTALDVSNGNGDLYTCCIEFDQQGMVDFFYYQVDGEILERFTGTTSDNDDDTVTLDLYLTGGDALDSGAPAYGAIGTFRMAMPDEDTLLITNLSGDPLLSGTEEQTILFTRSMG